MEKYDVGVIDMDAWFEENGWSMEDVFFKTDHHWLPQAAFAATSCTMEWLSERELAVYDQSSLNVNNWTITILEDYCLGSRGKRTGIYYAGLDDCVLFEPNFENEFTYSYLRRDITYWMYRDTPLGEVPEKDYFSSDAYGVYTGGNYPLKKCTNPTAQDPQRVLLTGDSYGMPMFYFLSTQFQEVFSIDLRTYTDGTFAEYVEEIRPDLVIMCLGEGQLAADTFFDFGVQEYQRELETSSESSNIILELGDAEIEAKEEKENFILVSSEIKQAQTYTLSVEETCLEGGEDMYVQMTLQDLSKNEAVVNRYFEANSKETQSWIFTVPDDTDVYALFLYAGTKGFTSGLSAKVSNIQLYSGICE